MYYSKSRPRVGTVGPGSFPDDGCLQGGQREELVTAKQPKIQAARNSQKKPGFQMAQRVDTVCLKVGDWISGQKHGGDVQTRGNVTMSKLANYLRPFETKPCQSCHGKHRFFLKGKEEKIYIRSYFQPY